jgi:hypothetical protein
MTLSLDSFHGGNSRLTGESSFVKSRVFNAYVINGHVIRYVSTSLAVETSKNRSVSRRNAVALMTVEIPRVFSFPDIHNIVQALRESYSFVQNFQILYFPRFVKYVRVLFKIFRHIMVL